MARSGEIYGTPYANGSNVSNLYDYWAAWQVNSSSIEKNTSNVTVWLRLKRVDGSNAGAYAYDVKPSVSLSVGGAARTPSIAYIDTRNKVVCTFATWTGDVKHNADGTLNCPIVASFTHYGSSTLTNGTLSGSAAFDTIPQGATIDAVSCTTDYFTGELTVRYTPKSATLYNRCRLELDANGTTTHLVDFDLGQMPAAQKTTTINLGDDELSTIYNQLTAAPPSGAMKITMLTYSDEGYSQQVGLASSKSLTLFVPDTEDTKPTVTVELSPVSSLAATFDGLYIQGKTKVKATAISAEPKYGTTISATGLTVQGKNYGEDVDYTSDYLTQSGAIEVYGYAEDGRGYVGNAPQTINVIAYGKPKLQNVVAGRCDKDGNFADDGTYLKISAGQTYSPVIADGTQKNFCSISYRWKSENGDYGDWTTILAKGSGINSVTTGAMLDGGLSKASTYAVQIRATDDVGDYAEVTIAIPTQNVYMHRTQNAMGLGKYAEQDGLDMGWNIHMNGNRVTGLPDPAEDTDAAPWGEVNAHVSDTSNPHGVTAEQIGAAPSGYGFASEDSATAVNDANLAVANGWYKCSSSVINIPQNCYEGWIFVESYNAKYKKQTYNNEAYGGIVAQRFMNAGVWGEWEWVNPATGFSTEYRTTQRYAGKPVYRKTVNFGYFSAGTHTRDHGIADIEYVVDFEVTNNVYGVYTGQFNAWMSNTQFGFTSPWAAGGICIVASYTKK